MAHLDDLKAAVTEIEDEGDSFIAFATGLATKLEEFKNQPAEIAAIAAQLRSQSKQFLDAKNANTDAE